MSLEKDLGKLETIHSKILGIQKNPNLNPSEKILEERKYLEYSISKRLIEGEVIRDSPVLDYCLRNFVSSSSISAFDFVPRVEKFIDAVNENMGQKILTVYGGLPNEYGIIIGAPEPHIENKTYGILYVPVDNLMGFNNGKWRRKDAPGFRVNSHIFSKPAVFNGILNKNLWKTDHSGDVYFGGSGRTEETEIYMGDKDVERQLKKERIVVVPSKEKRVSFKI